MEFKYTYCFFCNSSKKTVSRKHKDLGGISQNKKKKMEFAEIKKGVFSKIKRFCSFLPEDNLKFRWCFYVFFLCLKQN